MTQEERLDGLFMSAVQQSQGIENFFSNLFGFFRRRTDFFADEAQSRTKLSAGFETNLALYKDDQDKKQKLEKKKAQEKREAQLKKEKEEAAKAAAKAKEAEGGAQIEEITDEEAERLKAEEEARKEGKEPKETVDEEKKAEDEDDKENKGVKPNAENGGETDKYNWGQTLGEVTVNVPIPKNIGAKNLKVDMGIKKLKVQIKGGDTILEGEWCDAIICDDSLWCIETVKGERVLQLAITKKNQMGWWDCILKGDPKINTQKVEPENSKLSDLDGETRSTVEKMMFDQQQKQKGLPSSDELEKKNKLEAFMKAHPEMDFSQAKFC